MMHFTGLAVLAGSLFVASLAVTASPATAQSQGCGPAAYSSEHQRYVALPCTPQTDSAASPCGPASYSLSEQRYTNLPCTPLATTDEGNAGPCGPAAYSNEHQRYVGLPCVQQARP